jgi:hypothetical protein
MGCFIAPFYYAGLRGGVKASTTDERALARWATAYVESVLPFFEAEHQTDRRPRTAVEAGRASVFGEVTVADARAAALVRPVPPTASKPRMRARKNVAGRSPNYQNAFSLLALRQPTFPEDGPE